MQSRMRNTKTGEVSYYQNLRTFLLEPGVSPHILKTHGLNTYQCVPRVNTNVVNIPVIKKTIPVGICGLMA